jgi:hypothetical protein
MIDESGATGSNLRLIFGILESNQFILLLDGANEVPWSEQIGAAAAVRDRPGLFVTSQGGPPPGSSFEHWTLPKTIQDSILPLLSLWMGEASGRRLFERLQRSPLGPDIRSGYDVRLLQSIAETGVKQLPRNRIELYETMVAQSFDGDLDSGLADELATFAWELWLSGKRQFEKIALGADLTDRLVLAKLPLIRAAADRYEFMHDQIESYLAARHLFSTPNPFGRVAADEPRWRMRTKSEQADLWRFLRDMADGVLAIRLYDWALEEPEERIELQKAFRPL